MKQESRRIASHPRRETDAEIIARVARGDLGAIATLYDEHGEALLSFAARLVGATEAEDVLQDTFVRASRIAASFDPAAPSARPWLFGIAANVVRERKRALGRFFAAMTRLAEPARHSTARIAEEHDDVRKALARLSVPKRTVLVLAEVEGFSCDEIAAMLEIPVGTVWTRLHHARKELRGAIGERS